ncbi:MULTISPECIES: S8 family serine peptidase [Streptomyces]|uniref:Secreted peptidase n=1 Tax=Streptomyces coelicolor (strain ATCC BAA-471 / A3(2) / M145) TaxID=100226 RepID=Q9L0A0_STRCO|nr:MULTISPECIES: S8 family serine peptidase [Streptomyces]MDX2924133.1 S8 family serine peptidase [Streptomyces sp. NRRL_B-16638]MYU41973.1 peptidase [Streptomyces sp. SID7813]NSL81026.1 S8 family serine peptidase [Streptomyces coelicolor]QFI42591.1 peptidase [Streptomyces coelicolor A3(2)]QKN66230.1 S8 family serine peptidase [Streptomyces coelicolor]
MSTGPVRRGAALLSAGLVIALLPAGTSAAQDPPPDPARSRTAAARTAAADAARTVTLVTGDRVTVTDLGGGRKTVAVERPEGATGAVRTSSFGGRTTVVPDEALPYLRDGSLDERLFDVGALLEQGLADSETGELPLIVTYGKGVRAATPRGAERTRSLPSVRGAAVEADKGRAFWREFTRRGAGVEGVWLDGRVTADMAESNAQIGTPEAWEAGLTGKGVTVAVLDSGVDAGHPDLAGRIAQSRSFIPGEEVADRHGHGTHVTSTVGGSGAASDGKEKGVAPGATLAVGKVLDDEGFGSESEIIAGMEWAARDVDADIVSMSLGSTEPSDGTDPMAEAVNTLSRETGALFVIAAGNTGAPSSIGSPGAADAALTVGAVDSADQAAWFTSAGPRYGDNALKPDLSAPGVGILAARSRLAEGSGDYTSMDGTSMATPHIAGVAALLAEEHPDWSGARLKDALMSTSKELDVSAYQLGAGRVSVPAAVGADVTATGSADLGFYSWPYEADEPVTRTVAYTNSSDTDVELKLSVRGAPEGVATLADTSLTVPAHGTASTTVTGDGSKAPVGDTSGQVVAADASGKPLAHTAFGLVKEGERYTLTVHVKDRSGAATPADLTVQRLTEGVDPFPAHVGDSGTLKLRLEPGTYSLSSFLDVRGSHGADSLGLGFLAAPEVVVDRDREITLDGRELREIGADVGRRTETRQLLMEYDRGANGSDLFGAVQVPLTYDSVFAAPTKKVAQGDFEYRTVWRLGKPLLEVKGIDEATVQSGGTLTEGRTRLPLVDVGAVGAGPFPDGVRGKAVLARLTEGTEPAALAQAAQDAGVKVLFVTDDAPGRLMSWWGTDDNADRPLQIATVSAADARRLHRAGRVDMTGTRNTPYVYDLSEGHEGAVPDRDLTYEPGHRDLAVLRTRYHAAEPSSGGEFRYSLTDTFPIGLGFRERIDYPVERTEYVSTGPGQLWHETVTSAGEALEERGGLSRYRGGSRAELNWFKPVWHPYLGTGLGWGQQRAGNRLQFNAPGWGDSGPDHTGFGDVWSEGSGMSQTTSVYLDGEPVDQGPSSAAYVWDAPADEHTYRLVTDTALDAARWPLATKGHAEWTFRSAATPDDRWTFLPLINLSFDVDTDLAGKVRAGKKLRIGLGAAYVAGAPDTGKLGGGKLEASYDGGTTWHQVRLRGGDGEASWYGTLSVPRDAEHVSLRASARDDRGGSVTQEIVRAVAVR